MLCLAALLALAAWKIRGAAKLFAQAAAQIMVVDVSMSVDNVLAVAGAAREHMTVLVLSLGLSVVIMGVAAKLVSFSHTGRSRAFEAQIEPPVQRPLKAKSL